MGYSLYENFDFNVSHKKCKNTDSTKEDVFYSFTSGNSLNIFKCVVFHHSGYNSMGYNIIVILIVPCYH